MIETHDFLGLEEEQMLMFELLLICFYTALTKRPAWSEMCAFTALMIFLDFFADKEAALSAQVIPGHVIQRVVHKNLIKV